MLIWMQYRHGCNPILLLAPMTKEIVRLSPVTFKDIIVFFAVLTKARLRIQIPGVPTLTASFCAKVFLLLILLLKPVDFLRGMVTVKFETTVSVR